MSPTTRLGVQYIKYFVHPFSRRTVNIAITMLETPTSAVFMFHSTLVMNYITWNTIVSAYPALTLRRVGVINSARSTETKAFKRALAKYERRGYDLQQSSYRLRPQHDCGTDFACPCTERHIDDPHTMWIAFDYPPGFSRDVGDPGLSWRLARTQSDCYYTSWRSVPGWVSSRGGLLGTLRV